MIVNLSLVNYEVYSNERCKIYFKYNGILDLQEIFQAIESYAVDFNQDKIKFFLEKTDGLFSFLIETEQSIILISDIIRSQVILYSVKNDNIYLTNDFQTFRDKNISSCNLVEFLDLGFVTNDQTIFEDINAIQPAEIIRIIKQEGLIQKHRYFKFIPQNIDTNISGKNFVKRYNEILERIFGKMHLSNNRNWVVPLSGGHDSRQILNFFYKLNIKNVICFTYGQLNNTQAQLSKKVAENLNYEWHFIEYTEDKWNHLHNLGIIDKYIDFAFQGVSTPHLQDFLAVYELKEKNIIKKGDIFVPGHALDMIAGSHFTEAELNHKDVESLSKHILGKFSRYYRLSNKYSLDYEVKISKVISENQLKLFQFQEYFNWQERQAKFIANSCRVYEFFDFDFRLPFWDIELVRFFLTLPVEKRLKRNFFKEMERHGILVPQLISVPFEDEINIKGSDSKSIFNILRKVLPPQIRSVLVKSFGKKHYQSESLNQIYALRNNTVGELVGPIELYPVELHKILKPMFLRPTYRIDYHFLSSLYGAKRQLTINKKE